mmetsp:Transcript_9420/g.40821  ORF Transcript_9420/g.40821 Transcript_9420/m.40821 type:complete len:456 (-) Transcript_9420:885-2252(-)|eukprot:CAMPEP_0113955462 /NCGR_PEP_ID=MMETSP0011_2-20120614/1357_1 /TAXON_ID=101924 /ORGANISM="Rhodosorus marinus" /LENGTH=455 /DNA_ID=CAMNT_0000965175 /DNA_START=190 /DNA_END=1557 /DNA_ORIENTATION=- /assembly_acc=CAM_ASM_000156
MEGDKLASVISEFLEPPPSLEQLTNSVELTAANAGDRAGVDGDQMKDLSLAPAMEEFLEVPPVLDEVIVGANVVESFASGSADEPGEIREDEVLSEGEIQLNSNPLDGLSAATGGHKSSQIEAGEDSDHSTPSTRNAGYLGPEGMQSIKRAKREPQHEGREKIQESNTLFFPSVPGDVEKSELRELLSQQGVSEAVRLCVKKKAVEGFNYVWVKFEDIESSTAAYKKLRGFEIRKRRRLAPVFHHGGFPEDLLTVPGGKAYLDKRKKVLAAGGFGKTLLIRDIPCDIDDQQIEETLRKETAGLLRIRCSESAGLPESMFSTADEGEEMPKKCWATYSDQETCAGAFTRLSKASLAFDEGCEAVVTVALHDDTTDAHHPSKKGRRLEANRGEDKGGGWKTKTQDRQERESCRFFQRGMCTKGENCRYRHDQSADHFIKAFVQSVQDSKPGTPQMRN